MRFLLILILYIYTFYCRSLSRKDIQILVGFGCPSPDKKVVFSAKLLRKLVHLDEGDVSTSFHVVFVPSISWNNENDHNTENALFCFQLVYCLTVYRFLASLVFPSHL